MKLSKYFTICCLTTLTAFVARSQQECNTLFETLKCLHDSVFLKFTTQSHEEAFADCLLDMDDCPWYGILTNDQMVQDDPCVFEFGVCGPKVLKEITVNGRQIDITKVTTQELMEFAFNKQKQCKLLGDILDCFQDKELDCGHHPMIVEIKRTMTRAPCVQENECLIKAQEFYGLANSTSTLLKQETFCQFRKQVQQCLRNSKQYQDSAQDVLHELDEQYQPLRCGAEVFGSSVALLLVSLLHLLYN